MQKKKSECLMREKNRLQNVIYGKLRLILRLTGPDFKIEYLPVGWTKFAIKMSQSRIVIKNSSEEKAFSKKKVKVSGIFP